MEEEAPSKTIKPAKPDPKEFMRAQRQGEAESKLNKSIVESWSVAEVASFFRSHQLEDVANIFKENEIDGSALLGMEAEDIDDLITKTDSRDKMRKLLDGATNNKGVPTKLDEHDGAFSLGLSGDQQERPPLSLKYPDECDGAPIMIPSTPVEPNLTADRLVPGTYYQMGAKKRGIFLIINNRDFLPASGMENYPRKGTDVDCRLMSDLFEELGFQVDTHVNVSVANMRKIFGKVSSKDHRQYSAFGCCILSHGEEGVIFGTDGKIDIKELTGYFRGSNLASKPKMFFFQACQGYDYMDAVVPDGADDYRGMLETDGPDDGNAQLKIPSEADFIYAYSTVPGYYAWRNSVNGSWFIQSVVKVFRANAHKMDVGRMLTRVNLEVSKKESQTGQVLSHHKRQISSIVSQLRYDLYLFPPRGPLQPLGHSF